MNTGSDAVARTETLNETLQRKADTWTPEITLHIVEALRAQRDRWNIEQQTGSRKRVSSKQISGDGNGAKPRLPKKLKPGRVAGADALKGLML